MHEILIRVQDYLERVGGNRAVMPESLIEEFGELCKNALRKRFDTKPRRFTLRMSNVGRPLCQLIGERDGVAAEPLKYQDVMKFFLGDLIENAAIVIMKGAGVEIDQQQGPISLKVENGTVEGTFDISIKGDGIYDIKSASPYSFKTKFNNKYNDHSVYRNSKGETDDSFGYLAQGIGYGVGAGRPFRGWIAIDKSSGEWAITSLLQEDFDGLKDGVLEEISRTYDAVNDPNTAFAPEFEPEPEVYYKVETGNMVLGHTCSWCDRKWSCYPDMKALPQIPGKGENKKIKFYTSTGGIDG